MKGIILHGGAGTRLRPLTFSGPKQLIPIANKPVSQYVLEGLVSSGIRDIAIVLGETFPELVKDYYGDGSSFGARISYVYQGKPLGIAHAVGLCEAFVGREDFVVYLGDNLLESGIKPYMEEFLKRGYDAMVLLKEVEDPTRFGVAQFDGEGRLVRLIEKPRIPPSRFALVGVYFFKPSIFQAIKELKPSGRGELEITDAIQRMIERGFSVGYKVLEGWWLDTGKKDDVLYANMLILDKKVEYRIDGKVEGSEIIGRVFIGSGSKVLNSELRGPCVIGKNCLITDSFIGPYTSVGDCVKISNSSIEYSIVLDDASITHVERIERSLIGRNSKVFKNKQRNVLRFNIGDYSEVEV